MEHIFDNKKILEFTKNFMKDNEPKKEKPVEEAVGVTNTERKEFIKNYKKNGGAGDTEEDYNDHKAGELDARKQSAEIKKSYKKPVKLGKHAERGVEVFNNNDKAQTERRSMAKTYATNSDNFHKKASLAKAAYKSKLLNKEELEVGKPYSDEEFGEGMIVNFDEQKIEIVFDHGVEVFELEEDYHPSIEFHVTDKNDHVKGKYSKIKRARSAKDKYDNAHGSYAHSIKYYHKDKKKYVEFSETGPDSK